jgi:hypothetical protein
MLENEISQKPNDSVKKCVQGSLFIALQHCSASLTRLLRLTLREKESAKAS